jgi:hypothetical protein
MRQAVHDKVTHRFIIRKINLLRQIADGAAGRAKLAPLSALICPDNQPHQGGFARAVTANQADFVALMHMQIHPLKQRRVANAQGNVFQTKKLSFGHGGYSPFYGWAQELVVI